MYARAPSSSRSRSRGRFSTAPAARRRNDPSTAATASAGVSSASTSASVRYSGTGLLRALRDEAELAARLQHRPFDLVERLHLLRPGLLHQVLHRQAFAAQILLDRLAVLDEDQRLPVEHRPEAGEAEA